MRVRLENNDIVECFLLFMTKYIIFYDGDCGMCDASAVWLSEAAQDPADFEFIKYSKEGIAEKYPYIDMDYSTRGVQMYDVASEKVYQGHIAIAHCLLSVHKYTCLAKLMLNTFLSPVFGIGYKLIASNRQLISKVCGFSTCKI